MKSQVLAGNLAIGCRCFLCYNIIRETKGKSIDICGFFPTNNETLLGESKRKHGTKDPKVGLLKSDFIVLGYGTYFRFLSQRKSTAPVERIIYVSSIYLYAKQGVFISECSLKI